MTRTNRTQRRLSAASLLPVLGLVLAVTLTGCGDDGSDDGTVAAGQDEAGENSTDGQGSGGDAPPSNPEEAELAFYQCMRDNGVDMADPDPGQPGIQLRLPPDDPDTEAALEECRPLLPNGGEMQQPDAEALEALRDFTECMRENGVDMPDPNADGSLTMPQGLDPNSAEFQAAMGECQSLLNGAPVRIGPGPGGGQ